MMMGLATALGAQEPARLDLGGAMLANGEAIRYLRMLALTDSLGAVSGGVTVQPFGARGDARWAALAGGTEHPWQARFAAPAEGSLTALRRLGPVEYAVLRPDAQMYWRSSHPTSELEGVAWAGRGATLVAQGGVRIRWGAVRAQFAPVAFQAQNARFSLTPNGRSGVRAYRDVRFPDRIDLPQRFGDAAYSRVDLGDSFVEASAFGLLAGFSNARQHWGPASSYPLVLGTGSGGFQHFHWGTAGPLRTPVGTVQFRAIAAKIEQSEYSPIETGELSRFLSAAILSFSPAFARPFEIGVSRAVNGPWPAAGFGVKDLLRPFEGIINDNVGDINDNPDNGFAAVFFRVAPPGSGLEAYAEMSREDFSGSLRWLILEPDDIVQYTLGVGRTKRVGSALHSLRVELVSAEVSHTEREPRGLDIPIPPYIHRITRQGLTNRGQLLGSPAAYGGNGGSIAWERYTSDGRLSITAERETVLDWVRGRDIIGGLPQAEVRYGVRAEVLRFRGDSDWSAQIAPRYTLNRGLVYGRDMLSVDVQLRWRGL